MSSLSDIFNTAKNLVIAVNQLAQSYIQVSGSKHSDSLAAATTTVISQLPGRAVSVSVTTAGTTPGSIYDSIVSGATSASLVASIPNVVGVYPLGIPLAYGLVVTTGAGQVATVVYS